MSFVTKKKHPKKQFSTKRVTSYDPTKMIEKVIRSGLDSRILDQIDDSDMAWAPNFKTWIMDSKFSGDGMPFPRQLEHTTKFLGEYCPRKKCTDLDFWNNLKSDENLNEILDRVTFLEFGVCPKCGLNQNELFGICHVCGGYRENAKHPLAPHCPGCKPLIKNVDRGRVLDYCVELTGLAGQRSGKSEMAGGQIAPYHMHKALRLSPSPAKVFGLLPHQTLQLSFCAVTAAQSKQTVYDNFHGAVIGSPWYDAYKNMVNTRARELGDDRIEAKYMETIIAFPHKRILANFITPDVRSIRGRTRLFCVTPDTLVNTERGLVKMGELQRYAEKARTEKHNLQSIIKHHKRVTAAVCVTTERGYEIAGSLDHPIRVLDNKAKIVWKTLGGVQPGDVAVLDRRDCFPVSRRPPKLPKVMSLNGRQLFFPPKKLDVATARVLGYLCAEGCISDAPHVGMYTTDTEIRDDYMRSFKIAFGRAPRIKFIPPPEGKNRKPAWTMVAQSAVLHRWFEAVGAGGNSKTKEVPWVILQSPRKFIAAWLAGYFDGDGSLNTNGITGESLTVESKSIVLHKQIQTLLLTMGIICTRCVYRRKIRKVENGKIIGMVKRTYSKITLCSENLKRFGELVDSVLPRKRISAEKVRRDRDYVYGGFNSLKKKLAAPKSARSRKSYYYKCKDGSVRPFGKLYTLYNAAERHSRLTREYLRNDLDWSALLLIDPKFAYNLAKALHDDHLLFEVIESKKDIGVTEVRDITVEDEHSFISNGFISHNCSIDELSWFTGDSGSVRSNADGTHSALTRSLRTVRSAAWELRKQGYVDIPTGIMANISSPREVADKMMCLLRESKTKKTIYGFHHSTWDFNPTIKEDDPSLREEAASEEDFERDYGAIPPLAVERFMNDDDAIMATIDPSRPPMFRQKLMRSTKAGKVKGNYIYAKPDILQRDTRFPRILTVDTGETRNSFTACLSHVEFTDLTPKMVVDGLVEVEPQSGTSVSFPKMFDNMLLELIREFNVYFVVYDRWQSTDQVHRLDDEETFNHLPRREKVIIDKPKKKNPRLREYMNQGQIQVDRFSLKYSHFTEIIRPRIYSGAVRVPTLEKKLDLDSLVTSFEEVAKKAPIMSLILQMLRVREVGQKVVKPLSGNDDLFRALALGVVYAFDPGVQEILRMYTDSNGLHTSAKKPGVGAYISRVGGNGAGVSNSGGVSHPYMKVISRGSAGKGGTGMGGINSTGTGTLGSGSRRR